jgi:hypothetical protein
MPDNPYMGDAGGPPEAPPPEAPDETTPEKTTDTPDAATALLPKSVLGGKEFKPGEEVVLKVTHVYEDEVEVEYAPSEPTTETKPSPSADDEIDMMAGKGE